MISYIPLILGLGNRLFDPYVYVVFWAPRIVVRFHGSAASCKSNFPALSESNLGGPILNGFPTHVHAPTCDVTPVEVTGPARIPLLGLLPVDSALLRGFIEASARLRVLARTTSWIPALVLTAASRAYLDVSCSTNAPAVADVIARHLHTNIAWRPASQVIRSLFEPRFWWAVWLWAVLGSMRCCARLEARC